ncbi:polyprenol monophosphomannose synthase [Candidatus Sumerlaeota bacterium]|nr:polyprenol monophosphomannose synthase [Candidatus Sumerlaeota bacterium]
MSVMVTLPTFNESGNILSLMEELLSLRHDLSIVVIDDDSPDGTHALARKKMESSDRVFLIHRINQKGRGSAGVAGFRFALGKKADLVVEMDADYSHHPRFLPSLLDAAKDADIVIGSRLVKGGGEKGRSFIRFLITRAANLYIRLVLGLKIRDCTSGYRVFHRKVLQAIDLDTIESNGPAIVQEVLWRCKKKNFKFTETPILFEERRAGKSSFNAKIMLVSLWSVLKFRFKKFS